MTSKDVANIVSKFGGILFTPVRLTAVASCAVGPLKVMLNLGARMYTLHFLNVDIYVDT